ncbi:hypothetical protein FRC19_002940 [Serendipita sp. 401]|nr:hypothetical protein FRC19_002940 [Serendipita sp. 401]
MNFLSPLLLVATLASKAYAQGQLQVEAPFVPLACLTSFITFSGGQSPYDLSVLAADTRNTLDTFTVTNSPYLWSIPNAANRQLLFSIRDASGATAESGIFIVQNDPHFTCTTTFPGEASSISSSTSSTLSTSSILSSTTLPPSSSAPTSASTTTRTGAQTSSTTSQGTGGSSHQFPIHIIIPIAVSIFIVTFIIVFYIRRRTLRGTFVEVTINAEPDVRMSNLGREHTDEFAQSRGPSPRSSLQSSRHVGRVGGGFEYYTENSNSSSTPGIHSPPIGNHHPSFNYNPFLYPMTPTQGEGYGTTTTMPFPTLPNQPIYEPPPPEYQDHAQPSSSRSVYNPFAPTHPQKAEYHSTTGTPSLPSDTTRDAMSIFAFQHGDLITPDMEEKLRRAKYRPDDDPREISEEHWKSSYGIDHFELKRLQEAFDRDASAAMKLKSG